MTDRNDKAQRAVLAALDQFDRGATPAQVAKALQHLPADAVSDALDQLWLDNRIALHAGRIWLPWQLREAA